MRDGVNVLSVENEQSGPDEMISDLFFHLTTAAIMAQDQIIPILSLIAMVLRAVDPIISVA